MPVVTFDYTDFITLLGHKISMDELTQKLPMIGADLDKVEKNTISLEFFPNRPDLTSVEGIARAARAFFNIKTGLQHYKTTPSDIRTTIDPSVKEVRPFITTALIKNVTITDTLIVSLMDLQEKLHTGLGRNRKKVAIGVHNFAPLTPPFTYKAVEPDSVSFIPLTKTEPMTLREILRSHEKGIAYAHLVDELPQYPLLVDAQNNVLSFPPIINGSLTEVTPTTKELFIDVTGTDQKAVNVALNIITTALVDRGGHLFTTTITDGSTQFHAPDFKPTERTLSVAYVNEMLGTTLNDHDVLVCLEKMGYQAMVQKKGILTVQIPAWRSDILHEVDLVEDVMIGYGFDQTKPDFPKALTYGKELRKQKLYDTFRNIFIGLGFNEVTTFTISNEHVEFTKMGLKKSGCVQIENPIGEEYSCLRVSLLPSLLGLLQENKHHPLPQQIFEVGIIADENGKNHRHLGAVKIDAKASFTMCKAIIETILRDTNIQASIIETNHPTFVPGRCAELIKENISIGVFGELHPQTITAFTLEHPSIALELNIDKLHP
ncbi:MAG: phenylalanine--tRNA ligase subunit beta [Methanobacteriota archaeon]